MDVLVKIYFDTRGGAKGGRMSQAMDSLPLGHAVDFKGPIGKFEYLGRGRCAINGEERHVKRFAMICAGSGITPIFQIFRAVMQDPEDPTTCTVLNGNRLVEDILCKEDIDALVKSNEGRARVVYTLTRPPTEGEGRGKWEGLTGRIGKELVEREGGRPGEGGMVLICGPEAMEKGVRVALKELGWKDDKVLFF